MKKLILIFGIVTVFVILALAQQAQEGVITYEVKTNLHRRIPADREQMRSMIPEFRVNSEQLFFKGDELFYKPVEEDEDVDMSGGRGGMRMRFSALSPEVYHNLDEGKRLTYREFMGKKYVIEDSISITPWKFGSETKTIAGYECRQAFYTNEEMNATIVAWYTDKLRPFLGPENYTNLPGTVLEIDINDQERVITAKNVELRTLKKSEWKLPTGGQQITQAEFRTMLQEQMQRMNREGGGGRMFIQN
ncbi:MAG TPA: GLPGLI family protein [Cyclobacteriaceae bacterium]|nr:GLPGLI family protein [Cyclobacteriaceae bacterium]